jgi:hypothetical protein
MFVLAANVAIIMALLLPSSAYSADAASSTRSIEPRDATRTAPLPQRTFSPMQATAAMTPVRISLSGHTAFKPARIIRAVRAISIPFGLESTPHLGTDSKLIFVEGHGGCAAGQIVAVQITITQSTTGALAAGETQEICSGDLQQWVVMAAAPDPARFAAGPALGCGVARTRFQGKVTDTFEWCRDLTLMYAIFMPLVSARK